MSLVLNNRALIFKSKFSGKNLYSLTSICTLRYQCLKYQELTVKAKIVEFQATKVFQFSNVTYHKCSHSPIDCTLNGKNINVMLEYLLMQGFGFSLYLVLQRT